MANAHKEEAMGQPKQQHVILVTDKYLSSALSAKGIKKIRIYLDAETFCAHSAFPSNNRVRSYIREYDAGTLLVPVKDFILHLQAIEMWEIDTQVEFAESIQYTDSEK